MKRAFTLVELMVVVAVMGVMPFDAFSKVLGAEYLLLAIKS